MKRRETDGANKCRSNRPHELRGYRCSFISYSFTIRFCGRTTSGVREDGKIRAKKFRYHVYNVFLVIASLTMK